MSMIAKVIGVLMMIIGVIWILQGINILPGSFMTGQMKWAVFGAIALVLGLAVFFAARRMGMG